MVVTTIPITSLKKNIIIDYEIPLLQSFNKNQINL